MGDPEDGGDRVDGEDQVGTLDDQQHDEKRRCIPLAIDLDKEPLAVHLLRNRHEPAEEADERVAVRVDLLLVLLGRHAHTGVDQEGAEDIDDPLKALDQGRTNQDHPAAHDQGADDAPEQHTVLVGRRHAEVREQQDEDENIVDAERVFDQVAREELDRLGLASPEIQADVEPQRQHNPDDRPGRRLAHGHGVGAPVEHAQVQGQQAQDDNQKRDPCPNRNFHCILRCCLPASMAGLYRVAQCRSDKKKSPNMSLPLTGTA